MGRIPGSRRSAQSYGLTYFGLKKKRGGEVCVGGGGTLISASAIPTRITLGKTVVIKEARGPNLSIENSW